MKVLILGSGGREHALAWKIAQSPKLSQLFIAPGNAGTANCGKNVSISVNDFQAIKKFCSDNTIDMLVVGPEAPLVDGIHDFIKNDPASAHIAVIGPMKAGAMLEGSKNFAKEFMKRHNIPTAHYKTFDINSIEEGKTYLKTQKPPYVLKADGLAAGKGVLICENLQEAEKELDAMIKDSKFGDASKKVVVEQFLQGIEISVFVLTDGKSYKILPSAKDYKRIGEGDTGLNTGGMGSISPVPFADSKFMAKVEESIIKPTINGLFTENIPYHGFIFFGLINVEGNPYVIEYNVRMGDPEAESVIPRMESDLLDAFIAISQANLHEYYIETDPRYCTTIMLVAGGYPGKYDKGKVIKKLGETENSIIFHAGSKIDETSDSIVTNGGRVIAISSFGKTLQEALHLSYKNADTIDFSGKYFRRDLGKDLLSYL